MKIRLINFLLILSIIISMLSGIVSFYNTILKDERVDLILATREIIQQTTELLSLLKDMETSQRGYLLTGDESYLILYRNSISEIDSKFLKIKQLTSDNPLERYKIIQLTVLIKNRQSELEQTISLFKIRGKEISPAVVRIGKGQITMNKIRNAIKDINDIESRLLIYRNQKLENAKNVNYLILLISTIVIISVTYIAFKTINKNQRTHDKLVNQLQYSNLELQVKSNELHKLNKELAIQNDEIAVQSDHIENQKEELEAKNIELIHLNTEKNSFIGIATHDLKSPIHNIKGLTKIIESDSSHLSEESAEAIKLISFTTDKMLDLIKKLLDINRIEQGNLQAEISKTDIVKIIKEVISSFDNTAKLKNIEIIPRYPQEEFFFDTDKNFLSQILENLISNAIKFSPHNKKIWVNLVIGQLIKIEVIDEGQGIRDNEVSKLFKKFQKLSARPTGGENSTGLGLSITKKLVESINGSIKYERAKTNGANFIVEFNPVLQNQQQESNA